MGQWLQDKGYPREEDRFTGRVCTKPPVGLNMFFFLLFFKVLEAELESERMALSDERLKCQSLSSQLSDKERRLKESNEQLSQTRRLSERVGSLSPTPSQSASQAGGTGDYWNLVSISIVASDKTAFRPTFR